VEVVASLSQGRTAAAQCGLFTHKSAPVIFEPPCISKCSESHELLSFLLQRIQVNTYDRTCPSTCPHVITNHGLTG